MRKTGPILILVIGLLALIVDFYPRLRLPDPGGSGSRPVETKLGLDLEGGLRVEYRALPAGGKSPDAAALNIIRTIIENRVNGTGVAEPVITTQGTDRVVVELPGVSDPQAIEKLVGTTGRLDFVPIPPTATAPAEGSSISYPPLFSGDQIESATIGADRNGQRTVDFVLKPGGQKLFADHTAAHVGEYFAIVLDNNVVSAPFIQSAITGGSGIITGGSAGFSAQEMNNLVTILRYGSLPFRIEAVQKDDIPATLGAEFLRQTMIAAFIGVLLVFMFMLVYYRLPGAVASLALVYYALVILAIFKLIPVTLTLAGIAGFVLSVGMAVDANILIFERSKEELRLGKPLTAAIEAGFSRAWNSILDSNVSSLITAGILYWFGSSTIRGFALVLIIGVLTSMFTAITVTRTILRYVVRQDWARQARLFGVTEEEFVAARPTRASLRGEARGRV